MPFLPQKQARAVCERRERETEINYLKAAGRRLRPSVYLPGFLDMSEKLELCGPETEEMLPIRPLKHKSHCAALSYQAANIPFSTEIKKNVTLMGRKKRRVSNEKKEKNAKRSSS